MHTHSNPTNTAASASTSAVMQALPNDAKKVLSSHTKAASAMQSLTFDLKQLTEFNPALVYGFSPELTVCDNPAKADYLLQSTSQYKDMLSAYLYAQNEILPAIKTIGIKNITADQLIKWLHNIHSRIASSMADDFGCKEHAGKFVNAMIVRWHLGSNFYTMILKAYFHTNADLETVTDIVAQQINDPSVTRNEIYQFLELLLGHVEDTKIELPRDLMDLVSKDGPYPTADLGMHKLYYQYVTQQLNESENKILNKFLKYSTRPNEIPKKMKTFAQELLEKWRTCKAGDTNMLSNLLYFAFYELTEIHPYFNANGRTATCLLNIILRSLGKPSILMRFPDEKTDINSSYSKAIASIDTQPALLKAHIKARLVNEEKMPYTNELLSRVIEKRVELGECILAIKNMFPEYAIDDAYMESYKNMGSRFPMSANEVKRLKPDEHNALIILVLDDQIFEYKSKYFKLFPENSGNGNVTFLVANSMFMKKEIGHVSREITAQINAVSKFVVPRT